LFPRAAPRLLSGFDKLGESHPEEPHWYLAFVGIEPDRQRRGLGRILLAPVIDSRRSSGHRLLPRNPVRRDAVVLPTTWIRGHRRASAGYGCANDLDDDPRTVRASVTRRGGGIPELSPDPASPRHVVARSSSRGLRGVLQWREDQGDLSAPPPLTGAGTGRSSPAQSRCQAVGRSCADSP